MKPLKTLAALTFAASAMFASSAQAAFYYPSGPQLNVPVSNVTNNGWSVCHQTTYGSYGDGGSISNILNTCNKKYLMLATTDVSDSSIFTLLAAAPREDVTHFTPTNVADGSLLSNGSQWYFNNNYSWGFARGGDPVNRNSCDYGDSVGGQFRLCWHTNGDNISGGWRSGVKTSNYSSDTRQILQSDGGPTLTSNPGSLDFGDENTTTVSAAQAVTLTLDDPLSTGVGPGKLRITGPDAQDFSLHTEYSNDDCPSGSAALTGPQTCTVHIRFNPATVGAKTATLSYTGANGSVALTGNGTVLTGQPGTNGTNGVDGAPGANGTNGVDGAPGTNGTNGVDGAPGANGTNGTNGVDGAPGTNGINGTNGAPGTNGTDGKNGTNGVDGKNGTNGVDGKNGVDGTKGDKGDKGDLGPYRKHLTFAFNKITCIESKSGANYVYTCKMPKAVYTLQTAVLTDAKGQLASKKGKRSSVIRLVSDRPVSGKVKLTVNKRDRAVVYGVVVK